MSHASPVRGVIFDLDGTLTRPYFDFAAIRREIGLAPESTKPILESLADMSLEEKRRAEQILHRHEADAAAACELWEDALEVLAALRHGGVPIGLLTRNSRQSAEAVIARTEMSFDCVHTREDGPPKPAPDAVLRICRNWSIDPSTAWVVGDYIFDIEAGRAAGATTVLMIGDDPLPAFAGEANHVIRRLRELVGLLRLGTTPDGD